MHVTRLIVSGTIEERVLRFNEARHVLFSEATGEHESAPTTVQAHVQGESVGRDELEGLLVEA